MLTLETVTTRCPHCGEPIELVIDCSIAGQEYVEDCQVCCRPMSVKTGAGGDAAPTVELERE